MNDDIKEILDGFDKCLKNYELDKAFGQLSVESIYHLFPHKQLLLKDCITNLQQENQEMKTNTIPTLKHNIDALVDEVDELEDYKSRCEKAGEDIKFCLHSIKQEYKMSTDERTRNEMESCVQIFNKTLNILQNGSENDE